MTRWAPGPWLPRLAALVLGASLVGGGFGCSRGCGAGSGSIDADAGAPPPPSLPPQRFWLQDVQLEPITPGGAAPPEVHLPVHVEMQANGVVRSLPGETPSFEGRLPADLLKAPADRRGLMLYAQRLVELHHGKPDGLVIGRLYPGAFASVAPAGDASWVVAIPRHGRGEALLAFAAKDALGDTKLPDPPETVPGDTHFDFAETAIPFGVPLAGGPPEGWLQLLCGGFRVEDRLRQYYRGIEIELSYDDARSWLSFIHSRPERGPTPCLPRHVYRGPHGMFVHSGRDVLDRTDVDAIPPGYVAVVKPEKNPFRAAIERRSAVYWLSGASDKLECEEWQFRRRTWPDGLVNLALVRKGVPKDVWYSVELPKPEEADAGWALSTRGPKKGWTVHGCDEMFDVLKVDADRIYMRYFPWRQSWPEGEVVAFLPDEVEQWFLTREACEAVRRVAPQTRDSLAPGLRRPACRGEERGNTGYW